MRTAIIGAALLLASCANPTSVIEIRPGTYSVSGWADMFGGASGAQEAALQRAAAHCRSMGRQLVVTRNETDRANVFGAGTAAIEFQCQ